MLYIGYNHEVGGIGDFVYILFQYYYYYHSRGLSSVAQNIQICIPNHPLKQCIECVEPPEEYYLFRTIACASISNVFVKYFYNFPIARENVLLYSNMNDYLHLCVRHATPSKLAVLRREFRETVFRVSPRITEYVDTLVAASPAFYAAHYVAIHVRLGDIYLRCGGVSVTETAADNRCSPEKVEKIFEQGVNFLRGRNGADVPIFIFCDNVDFKEDLAIKYGCYYFPTQVVHVASTAEETAVFDTFAEFVLLSRATEIFAVSISNFSQVPAFIYDIPIFTVKSGEIVRCTSI